MVKPSETPSTSSQAPSQVPRRDTSLASGMLTNSEIESLRQHKHMLNEFGKKFFAKKNPAQPHS